jgi:hypothetical protein
MHRDHKTSKAASPSNKIKLSNNATKAGQTSSLVIFNSIQPYVFSNQQLLAAFVVKPLRRIRESTVVTIGVQANGGTSNAVLATFDLKLLADQKATFAWNRGFIAQPFLPNGATLTVLPTRDIKAGTFALDAFVWQADL